MAGGINPFVYSYNNPVNAVDPFGLWGFGATISESTEVGAGIIGAGQTGFVGAGFFAEGFFRNMNLGALASWGGLLGDPEGEMVSYPDCEDKNNRVFGEYLGAGLNLFITNANSVSDLKGIAKTYSFNLGWGVRVLSLQLSIGSNGKWLFSYGGPLPHVPVPTGLGAGASLSFYNTNTWGSTLLGQ